MLAHGPCAACCAFLKPDRADSGDKRSADNGEPSARDYGRALRYPDQSSRHGLARARHADLSRSAVAADPGYAGKTQSFFILGMSPQIAQAWLPTLTNVGQR